MLETEVALHHDPETVLGVGLEVMARYAGTAGSEPAQEIVDAVRAQARKRVAFEFLERRRTSWDHRKLGGTY